MDTLNSIHRFVDPDNDHTDESYFEHLQTNRVSYCNHLMRCLKYTGMCALSGVCFIVHGIYPDIFTTSGSGIIYKLNESIKDDTYKLDRKRPG